MRYYVEEDGTKTYFTFDLSGFKQAQMFCEKLMETHKVRNWKINVE